MYQYISIFQHIYINIYYVHDYIYINVCHVIFLTGGPSLVVPPNHDQGTNLFFCMGVHH